MKLLLVALCAAALVAGPAEASAVGTRNEECELGAHLRFLLSHVNTDGIAAEIADSLDDPDVQGLFVFIFGPEFRALYLAAANEPLVQAAIHEVHERGCLDIRGIIERIRDYLELPAPEWRRQAAPAQRNGVADLWNRILYHLNLSVIHAEAQRLYEESADFASFIDRIRSDEVQGLYQQLAVNPTFRQMIDALEGHGIDVAAIRQVLQQLLGW